MANLRLGLVVTYFVVAVQAFGADVPALPPPSTAKVDFVRDVAPLLEAHCAKCHARGQNKGSFLVETRASLLAGGDSGPSIVPGKSEESLLIQLVAGVDPDRVMPEKGERLTAAEIGVLRAWIDQGAVWPEEHTLGFRRAALSLRRPELPPVPSNSVVTNPIDRILASYYVANGVGPESAVSDQQFARRIYLDLIGLLPTPEELAAFEADKNVDKRPSLIHTLLGNQRAYADHWLTFWNDMLRNAYRGTGFIDGGRQSITPWLYRALYDNKPYDEFVRELVSAAPGTEGFTKGIVWRGVVNASQTPPVQAAQNVGQVFLGLNIKCASCHDSFVNYLKLSDSYALASVFADSPLEIHRCDKPTGVKSQVGFFYRELGEIDPNAPRAERMRQLATILTKHENGRLARTIVNRLWLQLMGRGLIEPVDELDRPAWNEDLLDWLASDLVDHHYDLKHTLALICESQAYGRPAVGAAKPGDKQYVFSGPTVKHLSAEQFVDAVARLTGATPADTADVVKPSTLITLAPVAGDKALPAGIWIWSHPDAAADLGGRILLRKKFTLEKPPQRAVLAATCDNELVVYLNGQRLASSDNWQQPITVDLTDKLVVGENVFAVEATNWPDVAHNRGTNFSGPNPAGFTLLAAGTEAGKIAWLLNSDDTWLVGKKEIEGWRQTGFSAAGWTHAVVLPDAPKLYGGQSNLAAKLQVALSGSAASDELVRTSLTNDDTLTRALGRPNREQVVTRRESIPTTLQALELTNGVTLDAMLKNGVKKWLDSAKSPDELITAIYLKALGRTPVDAELAAGRELLKQPATAAGVEDLLWAIIMLPEFQLIY